MTVETLTLIIGRVLPEPHAGLLSGILFGTKATLAADFKQALITTGTLHIVALSGMNISIIAVLVNTVLTRYIRRPIANIVSIVLIIGFILFVGPSPSVIRAAIMGSISLLAIALGRQSWPVLALILAVISMLMLNPLWLWDLSFQLSVLATLGIILFSGKHETQVPSDLVVKPAKFRILRAAYSLIADDLRVTLAAQVFTMPVIFFQFQRISLISPVTNILIGWLIAPVTVAGFTLVSLGLVWPPLAQVCGWFVWVILTYIIGIIRITALIPFASITW